MRASDGDLLLPMRLDLELNMSTGSDSRTTAAEDLSALADGELHLARVAGACGSWRADASSRATWHVYQLIGDVLRSEDLASDAAYDAAFVRSLSARLAAEPVVLAPESLPTLRSASEGSWGRAALRRRWSWAGPSAVAAGFVAVAGVLVVTRGPATAPPLQAMAGGVVPAQQSGSAPIAVGVAASPATQSTLAKSEIVDGRFVRDAGLDRYLSAHKHFAGSTALGVPSGLLRSATVDASGR